MSNRTLYLWIALAIALMMVLLYLNYGKEIREKFSEKPAEKRVGLNDIRGMEIYHNGTPYTLNLKQQTGVALYLNEALFSETTDQLSAKKVSPAIEKIVVYRFEGLPPLEVTPIAYDNDNLLLSVPAWSGTGLFKDTSHGQLKTLLSQTYDQNNA